MSWWNASGEVWTMTMQQSKPSESLEQACFDWMSGRETETWSCTGDACMSQKTPSMAGCDVCNHCKSFPMQNVGKLTPNWIPTHCWEVISVDTIRELPESKGYNAILVAVDRLSKRIHAMPTVTTVDSTELHASSLSMSGGTMDFQRPSSVTEGAPSYPISQEN